MADINFDNFQNEEYETIYPDVVQTDTYDSNHYLKSIAIYFLTIYGLTLIIQFILLFLYGIIYKTDPTFVDLNGETQYTPQALKFLNLWTQIVTYSALLIVVVLLLRKDLIVDFFKTKSNFLSVLKDAAIGFVLLYVASIAANMILVLLNITQSSENQYAIETMIANCTSFELVLFSIILVVVTPLIEELIFRKSLFGFLKKYDFSSKKMIIVSALIFGGIHVATTIISLIFSAAPFMAILTEFLLVIPYFAMGLALSYSYEKAKRNIFVPTIIHMANNLLSLILILFFPGI